MDNMIATAQPLKKLRWLPWFICFIGIAIYLYEYALRVAPSVMMHQLMHAYHLTARSFGNLSAFYYYIYAPMQLLVGLLMDRYGPRRLLTAATFCLSLGAYFFASTHHIMIAVLGRFMIGFGSAFAFIGVLKLITIWLPPKRFAMVTGITVGVGMMGGGIGDLSIVALTNSYGWRLATYFLSMVGLLLALLAFIVIREHNPNKVAQPDIQHNLTFKDLLKECGILLRCSQIWLLGAISCLMFLPISGFAESWGIPYFVQTKGFSNVAAASAISLIFLGWLIGAPLMGWFSDVISQRRLPLTIGAVVMAILLSYVLYVPNINHDVLYSILFVFGLFAGSQAIVFPISREISSKMLTATAIAITNAITMLAGVSVWLIGVLLELVWHGEMLTGVHFYSQATYQVALIILPIGLVVAVFLTFFLKETYGALLEIQAVREKERKT